MIPANELAGATCAGCASTLLGHPLDTIKVHLQTSPHLPGPARAAADLLRSGGGPSAFFRGIGPPTVNAVIMNTVMFAAFNGMKGSETLRGYAVPGGDTGRALIAGLVSGLVTACISTPTDYVKIQAQIRGVSSAAALGEVLAKSGGPLALFRGHVPNLGREGVFTMVYLGLYDVIRGGAPDASFWHVAAASSLTGAMAWVASYPCDTVKTIMQGSDRRLSVVEALRRIRREGGWRAFYRGCGTSTWRAMLVTSSRMVVYEAVKNLLRSPQ